MAEINDGAGNDVFIFFTPEGVLIKGFDHESALSPHAQDEYQVWDGIYENLPKHFEDLLNDEYVKKEEVTFCFWREQNDTKWKQGPVEIPEDESDGSSFLLGTIYASADEFKEWADDYFGSDISLNAIEYCYCNEILTDKIILEINSNCDLDLVKKNLSALY